MGSQETSVPVELQGSERTLWQPLVIDHSTVMVDDSDSIPDFATDDNSTL